MKTQPSVRDPLSSYRRCSGVEWWFDPVPRLPAGDTPSEPGDAQGRPAKPPRACARRQGRAIARRNRSTACWPRRWAEAKVRTAPPADDAEYLRRVYLDLVGKIPTAAEARDFLDDSGPDKRSRLVEELLDSPAYLTHATEVYRALLLPEADTDPQIRGADADIRGMAPQENRRRSRLRPDRARSPDGPARQLGSPRRGRAGSPRRAVALGLLRSQGRQARKPGGRDSADVSGHPAGVRPVPQPSLRSLEARPVLGAGGLFRRRLQAGQGQCSRGHPRNCRPPRAGDPRDDPDRQGRVSRQQASPSGGGEPAGASSWPAG